MGASRLLNRHRQTIEASSMNTELLERLSKASPDEIIVVGDDQDEEDILDLDEVAG